MCCYGFSQGRKSLYNTAVYAINSIVMPMYYSLFTQLRVANNISREYHVIIMYENR